MVIERVFMLFTNTKMVVQKWFWNLVSSLGCYLTNLSWRKLYREYKFSRKALK